MENKAVHIVVGEYSNAEELRKMNKRMHRVKVGLILSVITSVLSAVGLIGQSWNYWLSFLPFFSGIIGFISYLIAGEFLTVLGLMMTIIRFGCYIPLILLSAFLMMFCFFIDIFAFFILMMFPVFIIAFSYYILRSECRMMTENSFCNMSM